MFVDKSVVIDVPFNENCILQFETQEDHILVFTVIDGDMKDAQNFIAVWIKLLPALNFLFLAYL